MSTKKKMTPEKGSGAKKSEDVVMWLRWPRPMKVEELKKLGLAGAGCYGGDTCIAATSTHSDARSKEQGAILKALDNISLGRLRCLKMKVIFN